MGIRPELPAGAGVEREHMIEGDRHVHDAVDDDGRRLEALAHVELEDPGRPQIADIVAIDLRVGIVAGLLVIAVGVQEIVAAAGRKGGRSVSPQDRSFASDPGLAAEAGRKGGERSGARVGAQEESGAD